MTGQLTSTDTEEELETLREFLESGTTVEKLVRLGLVSNCSALVYAVIMTLSSRDKVVTARALRDFLNRVLSDPAWEGQEKTTG